MNLMKKFLFPVGVLVAILFISTVVGGEVISDPSEGGFGGTSNSDRIQIDDGIKLVSGTDGEYFSEIFDAGEFVSWSEIKLNFFDQETDASAYVVVVEPTETINGYVLNVQIANFTFTGKLNIQSDGEELPYWVDDGSSVYIKLDLVALEKKVLYIYYGDDSIGYEGVCGDVFILCDQNIYSQIYSGGEEILKLYDNLTVWDRVVEQGVEHVYPRKVKISYKYTRDIDASCGGDNPCDQETSIDTVVSSAETEYSPSELVFDDVNLFPFNQQGGDTYWRNKTRYNVNEFVTDKLDDGLEFNFVNTGGENGFSVLLTDVLVSYVGRSEVTYSLGNEEVGITIEAMVCEDADCLADKWVSVDEDLVSLPQSRYFRYKLNFEKNDFTPEVKGVNIYYDSSDLPQLTEEKIYEATVRIEELNGLGLNITTAKKFLDDAMEEADDHKYNNAITLADDAKKEADRIYDVYIIEEEIKKDQEGKKTEFDEEQAKVRADELLDLIEIAIGTADHSNVNTQRAQIMLTQAEIAYNAGNYLLSVERLEDTLDILGAKAPTEEKPVNIVGIIVLIIGLIVVGTILYSFVRAKMDEGE